MDCKHTGSNPNYNRTIKLCVQKGDTIWSTVEKLKSLGYKTTVAEFAELNNVDLAKGEQRTIPIGRTFNISKDTLTVKEADGEVVSQTVQKINLILLKIRSKRTKIRDCKRIGTNSKHF